MYPQRFRGEVKGNNLVVEDRGTFYGCGWEWDAAANIGDTSLTVCKVLDAIDLEERQYLELEAEIKEDHGDIYEFTEILPCGSCFMVGGYAWDQLRYFQHIKRDSLINSDHIYNRAREIEGKRQLSEELFYDIDTAKCPMYTEVLRVLGSFIGVTDVCDMVMDYLRVDIRFFHTGYLNRLRILNGFRPVYCILSYYQTGHVRYMDAIEHCFHDLRYTDWEIPFSEPVMDVIQTYVHIDDRACIFFANSDLHVDRLNTATERIIAQGNAQPAWGLYRLLRMFPWMDCRDISGFASLVGGITAAALLSREYLGMALLECSWTCGCIVLNNDLMYETFAKKINRAQKDRIIILKEYWRSAKRGRVDRVLDKELNRIWGFYVVKGFKGINCLCE